MLGRAGWVINTSKDQIPVQDNFSLGSVVDTKSMQLKIPTKKIEEIKDLIQQALAKSKNYVKEIAKIVGKLISFYRCTGPVARVMTRATYQNIAKAANWNCSIVLSKEAREELWWWVGNIEEVSGFTMKSSPMVSLLHFNHVFHRDASGTGMFLGMLRNNLITLVSKPFSEEEAAKSSTFCEVKVFWHFYMKTDLTPFRNASILQ